MFLGCFYVFLLTLQSFSVLFRVCVGLVPCVAWFQLFIIALGFNHPTKSHTVIKA